MAQAVERILSRSRLLRDELEVGERTLEGREVELTEDVLDLAKLFGGHESGQQAFLFAELDVPAAGEVALGAGCDRWMRWWLDGEQQAMAVAGHVQLRAKSLS